jgi:F1F0 ATPase subunit 2
MNKGTAMSELLASVLILLAGLSLGALFFGGLWWTVSRAVTSRHPALWVSISFLLRLTVVLGGLYLVGREHWQRLMICLLGFVIARMIVMRLTPDTTGWVPRT